MSALASLFRRELRVGRRIGGGAALGIVFFLILITLMPFAIGPDLNLLSASGRPFCGSRVCLPPCSASTASSNPTATTGRSTFS